MARRLQQDFATRIATLPTLTNLSVSFISLVRLPATGKPLTLKGAGQRAEAVRIVKSDDDRMVAYGIVYAPDQVDSHGDTADAATIRRAAYEFMREGRARNVDREHSFTPEMAYVAESWLTRADDPLFPEEPEGSWAVGIQIGDPDTWKDLKSGAIAGISLAGIARVDPAEPQTQWTEKQEAGFVAWLKALFAKSQDPKPQEEETQMDDAKVQEIVRSVLKDELGPAIKDAMKSANAPPASPPAPAPTDEATQIEALKAAVTALDGKIAVLTAKGATEVGGDGAAKDEESFL